MHHTYSSLSRSTLQPHFTWVCTRTHTPIHRAASQLAGWDSSSASIPTALLHRLLTGTQLHHCFNKLRLRFFTTKRRLHSFSIKQCFLLTAQAKVSPLRYCLLCILCSECVEHTEDVWLTCGGAETSNQKFWETCSPNFQKLCLTPTTAARCDTPGVGTPARLRRYLPHLYARTVTNVSASVRVVVCVSLAVCRKNRWR